VAEWGLSSPILARESRVDPLLSVARGSYGEVKCLTFPDNVYTVGQNSHRVNERT
jgi:hypothetical protein